MPVPGMPVLTSWRMARVTRRLGDSEDVVEDGILFRHPMIYARPAMEALLGLLSLVLLVFSPADVGWFFLLLGLGLLGHAAFLALESYLDIIVITNLRIFRQQGITWTLYSSMPLKRVVDITVDQSSWGQLFHYAHFTFESASGDRLLRDIKFVADPWLRDRVVQRSLARLAGHSEHRP